MPTLTIKVTRTITISYKDIEDWLMGSEGVSDRIPAGQTEPKHHLIWKLLCKQVIETEQDDDYSDYDIPLDDVFPEASEAIDDAIQDAVEELDEQEEKFEKEQKEKTKDEDETNSVECLECDCSLYSKSKNDPIIKFETLGRGQTHHTDNGFLCHDCHLKETSEDCTRYICSDCKKEFSCGNMDVDGNWRCDECYDPDEYTEDEIYFNENYPNASCLRCDVALDGKTVVYCKHDDYGQCETWYCDACHEEGTDDCPIYLADKEDEEDEEKEETPKKIEDKNSPFETERELNIAIAIMARRRKL